jgi:hypothetical protein
LLQSLAMHAMPLPGDDEEKRGSCFVIFTFAALLMVEYCSCCVGNGIQRVSGGANGITTEPDSG